MDERFNQTLQNMLIKYIDTKKNLWAQFLDTCIFAYNTSAMSRPSFLNLNCKGWFHTQCVKVPFACLRTEKRKWCCPDCLKK